jgi:serine phosphatase RsbU (regulator of sigma subunit)
MNHESANNFVSAQQRSAVRMMVHQIDLRAVDGAPSCGDFAEHLHLSPFRSALFVGDIAGHGAGVGHAADALHASVRKSLLSSTSLPDCMRACDDFFTRSVMSDEIPFASLFIAVTDERESQLHYASAGHEPGLLFTDTGRHRHLDPTGPILGLQAVLPQCAFGERVVPVASNELLVIVTDGITEARHAEGDGLALFGSTGVARAVRDARFKLHDSALAIHEAALGHARGALSDDASVVVMSFGTSEHMRATNAFRQPSPSVGAASRAQQAVAVTPA